MKSIKDLNEDKEKIKKYSEPDNPLQNMADHVGLTQIDAQIEILKEVLEVIDKWWEKTMKISSTSTRLKELKQKITGDEGK